MTICRLGRNVVSSLLAGVFCAVAGLAQPVISPREELAFERPEAWAMAWFASVARLDGFGPPASRRAGEVRLGLELASVPDLSAEQRRVGFGGFKEEDLNQVPLLVRPRLDVGLPAKWALTVALVPPVEVFDVETGQLALAIGRPVVERGDFRLGALLVGQAGTSKGAFTCTEEDAAYGDDPDNNPFGCQEPSADEATLRSLSLEVSASYRLEALGGMTPYLAVAHNRFRNRLQVDALTFGVHDRTLLLSDGSVLSFAGGASWELGDRGGLAVELYYTPLKVERMERPRETDALLHARVAFNVRLN